MFAADPTAQANTAGEVYHNVSPLDGGHVLLLWFRLKGQGNRYAAEVSLTRQLFRKRSSRLTVPAGSICQVGTVSVGKYRRERRQFHDGDCWQGGVGQRGQQVRMCRAVHDRLPSRSARIEHDCSPVWVRSSSTGDVCLSEMLLTSCVFCMRVSRKISRICGFADADMLGGLFCGKAVLQEFWFRMVEPKGVA